MDILKAVGLIGGSLGSLTVLFFWLGNAIVVARLRVYNLYGTVHYTEEYVKEAGFQFLTDVFTFFGRETLYGLFIIAILLIFVLIPVGPYQRKSNKVAKKNEKKNGELFKNWRILKGAGKYHIDERIRYYLFMAMVVIVSFFLISDHKFWLLSTKIFDHEDNLKNASENIAQESSAFVHKIWESEDRFKREFHRQLVEGMQPEPDQIKEWLIEKLSLIYPTELVDKNNFSEVFQEFQKDIGADESIELDNDIEKFYNTQSYKALLTIYLNPKIKGNLLNEISDTLRSLEDHLSVWLKSDVDFSTFVISPSSYDVVNTRIEKLKGYASNLLYFFEPADQPTRQALKNLKNLKAIHFCGFILSFSFWILIGLLVYLLINISNFFRFERWERIYFLSAALLFLIMAIVIPNTYGKYRFEFRIQEVRPIAMGTEAIKMNNEGTERQLITMIEKGAVLYTLGPTRDKEVIIAVTHFKNDVRIILLDKGEMKNMALRPVQPGEIPPVINLLRKII